MLSGMHVISIILTLCLVAFLGVYSMRQVKSASDFSVGGRSISTTMVFGTMVGTLVGGAATIGTAQLAYNYGFSAWWFTLGGGIACALMGILLAKPLRQSQATTGSGLLASTYGQTAGLFASVFSSLGTFLNVIAQVLSAVALLTSIFKISPILAALIAVFLIIIYVIFGGVWGTGMVGSLKILLLYISLSVAGYLAYTMGGGLKGFTTTFESFPWFSLFGRGLGTDLAAAFSMLVGILSTQTYLQAMFSGRSVQVSRNGAIISGFLVPPIGLAAVLIGLYMRANYPNINPQEALPLFILEFLPHWLGGIVIATLLVTIIGTGAGLVLGISTMLTQDIYKKIVSPKASEQQVLRFTRFSIVGITTLTLIFVFGSANSLILKWSFLSMGLRGATICFPLLLLVFKPKLINPWLGTIAIALAPIATIVWAILGPKTIDPLYIGLFVSAGILLIGSLIRRLSP